MARKIVLFLGGAYAQIPIIKEAKERGWYIITCDYLPENPGHKLADEYYNISTTDFDGVLNLAKQVNPDYVIAYASDPAAPTAAYVSEKLKLPGNPFQSIRTLSEKDLFRKFLSENGFNTPQCVKIHDGDNVLEKINSLQFPIIFKPTDSSGSKGVSKALTTNDVIAASQLAFSYSRNRRIIAEEFIDSNDEQLHGDGFVVDGELIFSYLGDHHYNKSVNAFVPYSTTWPSYHTIETINKIENEVSRAVKLSGYRNGAINIEVRVTRDNKIYIMEIGPRSGGNFVPQIIQHATGFNMVSATLDVLLGETEFFFNHSRKYSAYYVLHSEKDGILKDISISKKISPYIQEFHQYIKIGQKVLSYQGSNAAIGVVLLLFNTRKEMNDCIDNMKEHICLTIED